MSSAPGPSVPRLIGPDPKQHTGHFADWDRVAAYLASDRRMPYGSGIWRHYPELDEE